MVIVDFGVAKRRGEPRDADLVTSAREVLGTLAYLAPEQLEHGLADERSDVWGLGCVLYEMLVEIPPFGKGGSTTTAAILRDEPEFPPSVPATLVHIIGSCLRKSSFARVSSARDLLVMLRDAHVEARTNRPSMRPSAAPPASVSAVPALRFHDLCLLLASAAQGLELDAHRGHPGPGEGYGDPGRAWRGSARRTASRA